MRMRAFLARSHLLFTPLLLLAGDALARDLTFEDRVMCQEAIERAYYRHQIGATRLFEEAVPRDVIESKVRKYLKQSVALEAVWHTPVTDEMLQRELGRILRQTRMPERLSELFAALENDSFLIQECLARPALVDRLARSFFAFDREVHDPTRRQAEALRMSLIDNRPLPNTNHIFKRNVNVEREEDGGLPDTAAPQPYVLGSELSPALPAPGYLARKTRVPQQVGEVGEVLEERDWFSVVVRLPDGPDQVRVEAYVIEKTSWDDWWSQNEATFDETSVDTVAVSVPLTEQPSGCTQDSWDNGGLQDLPDPRLYHSTVWTGTHMIVWGGTFGSVTLGNGARYDPATDTWTSTSTHGAPSARERHTAIWTGRRMVVWGGYSFPSPGNPTDTNTGGSYDPAADSWTPLSMTNAPCALVQPQAVWAANRMIMLGSDENCSHIRRAVASLYDPSSDTWTPMSQPEGFSFRTGYSVVSTGDRVIVWGGYNGNSLNSGSIYDPQSNTWRAMSTTTAPEGRIEHTAVWTGSEMVVWGGYSIKGLNTTYIRTGGRYNPAADTWTSTSTTNAPQGRRNHSGVWTGTELVVWGGTQTGEGNRSGARYDPTTDTWRPTTLANAPEARSYHTAVWTGSLMVVWGGVGSGDTQNSGGRYDPISDSWTPTSTGNAPTPRYYHTAVWTGNTMVVWGGSAMTRELGSGGRYDPTTDSWTTTSLLNAPTARTGHTSIWTGDRMVVWGGATGFHALNTGKLYDPVSDVWTTISTISAPIGRGYHTAIWTGSVMIVWGGWDLDHNAYPNSGGRYDPANDSWTPMSTVGAPLGRMRHSAVWTGQAMVIWGGGASAGPSVSNGAVYDPVTNTWRPTALVGAPQKRSSHVALWTGRSMVIFGGVDCQGSSCIYLGSGSSYVPSTNSWTSISTIGAPAPRFELSGLWNGSEVIVWGGDSAVLLDSGGRFNPATNSWAPTSMTDAPSARRAHSAVWTGNLMLVWGGRTSYPTLNSGGRYCACPGPALNYYQDGDGDGYGDRGVAVESCSEPVGFTLRGGDCDDNNDDIHPGASETCDRVDDDCDGLVDEGFDVGTYCEVMEDECHQVVGQWACRPDGTGNECKGLTGFHDATPPIITCPEEVTAECPAQPNLGSASVTDGCDQNPMVVNDAPSVVHLGETVVTWTATDGSGNSASCQQSVRVYDTIAPTLTVMADPPVLWPPNHEMVPVHVGWQVDDLCDSQAAVTLISATSGEPDDAPAHGDGDTNGDIVGADAGTPDTDVELRAERDGFGPGRVYELTYRAADGSGNTTQAFAIVRVPHDQGAGPEPILMRLETAGTPGMVRVYWSGMPDVVGYDLISGELSQVRVENRQVWLGAVKVLVRSTTDTSLSEGSAGVVPPPGTALFYLIQSRTERGGMGYGTESAPWPRVPASCEGGCP